MRQTTETIFQQAVRDGLPAMDFVGDFNAKYAAEVDPWEQSGRTGEYARYYDYSRRNLVGRLTAKFNGNAVGLEVGCGYGYLTSMLAERQFKMTGLDVSELALKRAAQFHPGIEYVRADITAERFAPPGQFHFVIMAQCWWYVLHELDRAVDNCLSCLHPGGVFVLSQGFLDDQRYGKDVADGFDGALRLLMSHPGLRLVQCSYDDTGLLCLHDGLIMLRKIDVRGH